MQGLWFRCGLALVVWAALADATPVKEAPRKMIIAYVFGKGEVLKASNIDVGKLTRINYAFANIKKGRIAYGFETDRQNLQTLNDLKRVNPRLQILISVGGWSWSGHFSDMALTHESRAEFISSAVTFLKENQLDGVDIDWEYPGQSGNGNKFRPEDKANFTLLMRELREQLDVASHQARRHLLLSFAAGASQEFLDHTDMKSVGRYVDSVNLMSYDYYVPDFDRITGHHAPLHASPSDPKQVSAESSVALFEAAGVPARKLVLGIPFYGHAWKHVDAIDHGLFRPGRKSDLAADNKSILVLLSEGTYSRYWDPIAGAPYLYSPEKKIFISYEDPRSIALKCQFVKEKGLGGVMFWEYGSDPSGELLSAISRALR